MHPADDLARRTASRLASLVDSDLPTLTEKAIYERDQGPSRSPSFSIDPATATSIAAVIVSASQFAYQIYRDLRADREKKAEIVISLRDELLKDLRMQIAPTPRLSEQHREEILKALADEVTSEEA